MMSEAEAEECFGKAYLEGDAACEKCADRGLCAPLTRGEKSTDLKREAEKAIAGRSKYFNPAKEEKEMPKVKDEDIVDLDDLEDADDEPKPKKKAKVEEDEDEPKPKKKAKVEEDEDEPKPKKKAKVVAEDDDEPKPKKKGKKDDEPKPKKKGDKKEGTKMTNQKIKILVKENPKRETSFAYKMFELTRKASTTDELFALAAKRGISPVQVKADIRWNIAKKFIRVI